METFLVSTRKLFVYYKSLADKTFDQIEDKDINWKPNEASNSIATIVHHITGNILSRFTDFLTSDGEKPWRNREAEFEDGYADKNAMLAAWENAWSVLFSTLDDLKSEDLTRVVYIRNEGHTVMEAVQRQLAHYAHHIGQIIFVGKYLVGDKWQSLSIPKGGTKSYNEQKFSNEKGLKHFTDKA